MEEIVKGIPYVNRGSCGLLLLSEICYIDCNYRKSLVHTDTEVTGTYISPKDITRYLDERFYQGVATLIINFDKVKTMKGRELTFLNGESLMLSRNCYLKVRKDFIDYLKNLQKTLANS
ncbi:MAG: LytTR family transcriptional regulator DNA-binding domain-containing protein [Firmicutes bacterium]|nr:LytTR family transcriptional regulator DNA-binding domain-containing protein [Bacillota bacterium]